MSKSRRISKKRTINPKFWIFCEGKTEKVYVEYLRAKYRLPVKVIPKIAGQKINNKIINKHITQKEKHTKDKVFLLYDADDRNVLRRLQQINNVILLASNPSIELWFLLHYKNQTANITTERCIRELSNRNRREYQKGILDDSLKKYLDANEDKACKRAKKTSLFRNPSTNILN